MKTGGLVNLFEKFLDRQPLFRNKSILQSDYAPNNIIHRDQPIKQLANILMPSLRLDKPSNVFVYGKTGTGKTCVVNYVTEQMVGVANKKNIPLKILYLNCKLKRVADTEYRLIAQLTRQLGKEVPPTGLPTDEIYKIFFKTIDSKKHLYIIVLDEIDQLIKKAGDEILYNLTRINTALENSQVSIVGVSNDLFFTQNIDPRVKSSLSEEEIVFRPYNALQLQDILRQRVLDAFKEGTVSTGVVEKCAAYAAREHGDARRAIELMRVAGEIAERENKENVDLEHIDKAEEKIERDRTIDTISVQPKQYQAILYGVVLLSAQQRKEGISTGEVYTIYQNLCTKCGLRPLTQRRVTDIIGEFDMQGIINAKTVSKGRYGRTREISLAVLETTVPKIKKIIEASLNL